MLFFGRFRSSLVWLGIPWLVLVAPPPPGNVLVVDAGGSGAYTQIQAAVDAAQEGDTILVKAGTYASFAVNGKALAIVGDTGHDVHIAGVLRAHGLDPQQALVLANLKATGAPGSGGGRGLFLADNSGSIRVENCTFDGAWGTLSPLHRDGYDAVFVRDSTDVSLTRVTARGGLSRAGFLGYTGEEPGDGGIGLSAADANVVVHGSSIRGGYGFRGSLGAGGWDGGNGGDACSLDGTTVLVSDCELLGGNGGTGGWVDCGSTPYLGGHGGYGMNLLTAGNLARLQGCTVDGGTHGCDIHALCNWEDCGYPDASSRVGGAFVDLTSPRRSLVAPTPVREGTNAHLVFEGNPGDRVNLFIAGSTQSVWIPAWDGTLLVRPRQPHMMMILGTIPGSAVLTADIPIPELGPGVQSRIFYLQAVIIDPQGLKRLGSPASMVILDSAF